MVLRCAAGSWAATLFSLETVSLELIQITLLRRKISSPITNSQPKSHRRFTTARRCVDGDILVETGWCHWEGSNLEICLGTPLIALGATISQLR